MKLLRRSWHRCKEVGYLVALVAVGTYIGTVAYVLTADLVVPVVARFVVKVVRLFL